MKGFIKNCRKYWNFCSYSAYCQLNIEVVGMRLGWIWWFLEPILFMGVYTFVFQVVFGRQMEYLMAYISSGLMMWNFFQRTALSSISLAKRYSGLLSRVYMPKYVLVISNMMEHSLKMCVNFLIVLFFMAFYQIQVTWSILQVIPVMLVFLVFTFGVSVWFLHLGVYLPDLRKICSVLFQILFYISGVFFSLEARLGEAWSGILLNFNPVARLMYEARIALLYGDQCSVGHLLLWFAVGLVLSITGVMTVTRYEKNYIKVM